MSAFGDALAAAEPAAAQRLQQLAAPGADAASKAAALRAQVEDAGVPGDSEAAAAGATQDLAAAFSSDTPTGQPAVPCGCGDCIRKAVDPAATN